MHSKAETMAEDRSCRRDLTNFSPSPHAKRQKLLLSEESRACTSKNSVGATELASAFALASLATMTPALSSRKGAVEARDPEDGRSPSWESHIPQKGPLVVSPEKGSPGRIKSRVRFSPNVGGVDATVARLESFPPRRIAEASRLPVGFARGGGVPTGMPREWLGASWGRQCIPSPLSSQGSQMRQLTYAQSMSNEWVCDFCNVASFHTFEQACMHEEVCQMRRVLVSNRPIHVWHPMDALALQKNHSYPRTERIHSSTRVETEEAEVTSSHDREWFRGSISLANAESDPEWLSEMNCYIRSNCVEAFSATQDDVARSSKRGRIGLHQVGVRCRFCKTSTGDGVAIAAVSFPTSMSGLYESVKRWQRVHLPLCHQISESEKRELTQLSSIDSWTPTTRQYWADSAKSLGMVDTDDGIRFGTDISGRADPSNSADKVEKPASDSDVSVKRAYLQDGEDIVSTDDMSMVPSYVYFLMRQVESCQFTEADRFVARSKGPVGCPGFQCRHCHGHAGLGKYFPISSRSLSTNSTSQNIHAHILKCRKCPPQIKEQLVSLKEAKSRAPRLEPGWRKIFFDKVWERLHGVP